MIIINLKGGLGNQMFQYALGRHLAIRNKDGLKLEIDGLRRANAVGDIQRPFSLKHFNIKGQVATAEEVRALKYPFGVLSKAWRFFRAKILRQKNIVFNRAVLDWRGDIFLDGYWQSPRYFEEIRDTLLAEFTLKNPLPEYASQILQKIRNTESVSVHIRRGDYANNQRTKHEFGLCGEKYYQEAVQKIRSKYPESNLFIFSDDVPWVETNLDLGDKVTYVQHPELIDAIELTMMSRCKHNIIANSSFSWWAAWLNDNPQKMVVAPIPWFNNNDYDPSLIPDLWIKLPK